MTFRLRLLVVMLLVVVVSQLVTGGALLRAISQDALEKGDRDLGVGLRVLDQVLDERGRLLQNNVEILANDFGFKSAVATRDTGTLQSVLANHGDRAGADMVLLSDLDGTLLASSHHPQGAAMPFPTLWEQARAAGAAVEVVIDEGKPYEFVLLPVRAPNLIGWVGMGFMIDQALASEIHSLTRLDISFITHRDSGEPGHRVSSRENLDAAASHRLTAELASGRFLQTSAFTKDDRYLTRAKLLQSDAGNQTYAVVQASRESLLGAYRDLQWQLGGVLAVILLFTAALAAWSARSMGRPLSVLADAARNIGRGQNLKSVDVTPHGEIGLLADTLLSMQEDIRQREQTLLHQSRHDRLTGLPNRSSAQEDTEALIRQQTRFSLLRMEILDFRRINDTFGYALGDRVLITLAQRLRDLPPPVRNAYRLGTDEFLLVVEVSACDDHWVESLLTGLSQPIDLNGSPIHPDLLVGEANHPDHGNDVNLLLRRADIALHTASARHQRHQRYLEGQDEEHLRQLTLIRDLQHAVTCDQLHMVYQPKIDASNGEVVEFEALMRWQHPSLGFIPPDEFITLAERSGNIRPLSRWMFQSVCSQLAAWQRQGQRLSVAINLSAADLVDTDLADLLLDHLRHHGLQADQLGLEITESAVMEDATLASHSLNRLRQAGLTISVDDFGTGYSSLAQLKRLPVGELKIDKSFILQLDSEDDDATIVRSTIEMGHSLGLRIVAEGVENAASAALLKEYGCDFLQGYWIARPLPADSVIEWLGGNNPFPLSSMGHAK
ncbi:putative bifunctional diguanylate cyclase/phosphodiesterase [Halomonas sp. BC04]|uniref:putative bifunctional diguanylate cyclase/phosphodiesterase n=1 Tax=Halomonas sp. BC04 TaxID=1403540 RepID=UPI0003ED74DB|nr:EAL domain-containing protein [Halomonas sp. BC04]EWH03812.1 diguanylate cyclase [Halomonas sp. BC04]